MTVDTDDLGMLLRNRGKHMSRRKRQRPEVYAWRGKGGTKYWKAEWRQYIAGRPKPKHRSATWPCSEFTKSEAQEACDKLVKAETTGPLQADGSMTVKEFWERIYWPSKRLRIAQNTAYSYSSNAWRRIEAAVGSIELQRVTKTMLDGILDRMAGEGLSRGTIDLVRVVAHGLFSEAQENGYITRNPCHAVTSPRAPGKRETRPLSEAEAARILALPASRTSLLYKVMLLTGARISEVLSLTQTDLRPDGTLLIDESNTCGKLHETKSGKARIAPLPPSLRKELEKWAAGTAAVSHLIFPTERGRVASRNCASTLDAQAEMRRATGIGDLTPRMCRTTFATLFRGDPRDIQAILGHSTVDLTMSVYRKPILDRQTAAVQELEARLKGKVVKMKRKESA